MKSVVCAQLDFGHFLFHTERLAVNGTDAEQAEWFRTFRKSLATGNCELNEYASHLIGDVVAYRAAEAERKRLLKEKTALSKESALSKENTPLSLVSSSLSSCISPVSTEVPKRNTVPARENPANAIMEAIWQNAPAMSRQRSSKPNLLKAIQSANPKIDAAQLPAIIEGLCAWVASEKWTKDNGQFQEGIHRWVNGRQWETLPQRPETWQERFERDTNDLLGLNEVQP